MKFLRNWGPAIAWAALIFSLSSIPSLHSGFACDFLLRKMAHVTEYFVLTFLLYRALKNSFGLQGFYLTAVLASISLLYAISDEFHQIFVVGREGCPRDVLIDSLGIIGFYLLTRILRRRAASQESGAL